jgi:hypothetical protein
VVKGKDRKDRAQYGVRGDVLGISSRRQLSTLLAFSEMASDAAIYDSCAVDKQRAVSNICPR